ncbi:BTAD domain-containing putative transcriptional regulator [Streptosporangium sp. 'caverna']|uniref:AfsR/SARP family transcriptional regulator n=1 Tax=Streptosporangium sp. 'caverna' TaxID=2202249 RepID=UPI0013A68B56|nr:BTAD domain-containing putative transcriptional regulator [Streptosporangium sp. 'caverna']
MRFTILGPVRVRHNNDVRTLGRSQRRGLLGFLLLNAGRVVPSEAMIDALWDGAPPSSARAQIYSGIHAIRSELRTLGLETVTSVRGGYALQAGTEDLDLALFEACERQARSQQDPEHVVRLLRQGLGLWNGPALSDASGAYVESVRAHLEEKRLACVEGLIDAELALGRHGTVISEFQGLVGSHPLRERLRAQLMLALYRSGRRIDALDLARNLRRTLVEQHGLDPGHAVVELEQAILRADPSLDLSAPQVTVGARRASPGEAPAQLPADTADFTGRDQELAVALRTLTGVPEAVPRICAVTGPPGVGKTVFAVHVAHRVREHYPDCQLFVDLRGADTHPADPGEVLAGFLRALGVDPGTIPESCDERSALYRTLLANRRALVVLDNAMDETQVRPLLPGAATCAVLVTGRRRLTGLGAQPPIGLRPFDDEESVTLLSRIAGAGLVAADDAGSREVARLCGGLPLALRIAGARLAARPHHGIGELAKRLTDEHRRLDELTYSGLAVRASLDLSYQGLSEPERRLLRRLAFLDVPEATPWLAVAVGGEDRADAEEMLESLTDIHLMQVIGVDRTGQVRYGLHDLVRAYCRERMADEESAADAVSTVASAARHLLRLATEARAANWGRDYHARLAGELTVEVDETSLARAAGHAVTWLGVERATLAGVIRQTSELGLFNECWRIAMVGSWLYDVQSYTGEYRAMLSIARQATRKSGDRRAEALVMAASGELRVFLGAVDEGEPMLREAEQIFAELGDEHGLADVGQKFGTLERLRGEHAAALRRYQRLHEFFQTVGDHDGVALALRCIGQIHLAERRPGEALPYLEEALAVAAEGQNEWRRLTVLLWLGEVYRKLGRPDEARAAFLPVAQMVEHVGDASGGTLARLGLAEVAIDAGDHGEARAQLVLASEHAARCGILPMICKVRVAVARARLRAGDLAEAAETIEHVLPLIVGMTALPLRTEVMELLAEVREQLGDPVGAARIHAEIQRDRADLERR